MQRVGAIVPAAGRSERMAGIDKLFLPLEDRPLLAWCVDTLEGSPLVERVVVAVSRRRLTDVEQLARERGWAKSSFVPGGERRQDSVARALEALDGVDWVLVHDGDRPFLDEALIVDGLRAAQATGVAVAAVPVTDTIKLMDADGMVLSTPERDALRAVQTPQVLRADIMRDAYSRMQQTVTDDSMLAERLGYAVRLYPGSSENLKVTTPDDLIVAQAIARRRRGRP